jgi:SNF family Na+-dependent transporter
MNGFLVLCLFLSYVCVYFSAWKGVKSTGKMVWVTCTAPYVILTVLLIKGLTLEGSGKGLEKLFVPDWKSLGNGGIWRDAAVQILFSSGVSFGPLMYYGSARKANDRILKASFFIPLANSLTSIYAALTVFTFLGHVSFITGKDISEISVEGMDLAFVAYPGLLGQLAGSNFWAIIFFLMLVTLGVDSVFGMVDFTQQMFIDMFPKIT